MSYVCHCVECDYKNHAYLMITFTLFFSISSSIGFLSFFTRLIVGLSWGWERFFGKQAVVASSRKSPSEECIVTVMKVMCMYLCNAAVYMCTFTLLCVHLKL